MAVVGYIGSVTVQTWQWWVFPIIGVGAIGVFGSVWFVWWHWLPKWKLKWWMRKNLLPADSADAWFLLRKKLDVGSLTDVSSAHEVLLVYRRELTRMTLDEELAVLIRTFQTPEVISLGSEVRPLLTTMYRRARGSWRPSPEKLLGFLTELSALRSAGTELDTVLAYLKALRPDRAIGAMEQNIPIEYATQLS